MDVIKIIFWVCVVETVFGHLPWTAPLAVFGVALLISMLKDTKKKKDDGESDEEINKIVVGEEND